jgi:opacity protein-like surface antigen
MLKTTIIAAALLSAAVAAPAMAQEEDTLGGFYGGAQVGYAKPKTKLDFTPKTGAPASGSANKTGFDYGGFIGYGAVVGESLYLGGEASLGAGGGKASRTLAGSKVTVDPGLRYGVAARAGFVITEGGLLYGKVGLERRKVETSIIGSKKKITEKGLVYGVGYEQQLTANLAMRGEVMRAKYDDKTATFSTGDKVKLGGSETRLNLGAVIRF